MYVLGMCMHTKETSPPWLEGRRPYVRCLYMYACLAMVYIHIYQAIILWTRVILGLQNSLHSAAWLGNGLEHILEAWPLMYTDDRYVDHQAAYICRLQAVFFLPKYTYSTYFRFASRYTIELYLAGWSNHHVRAAGTHLG
jgi:hypothetical protein